MTENPHFSITTTTVIAGDTNLLTIRYSSKTSETGLLITLDNKAECRMKEGFILLEMLEDITKQIKTAMEAANKPQTEIKID